MVLKWRAHLKRSSSIRHLSCWFTLSVKRCPLQENAMLSTMEKGLAERRVGIKSISASKQQNFPSLLIILGVSNPKQFRWRHKLQCSLFLSPRYKSQTRWPRQLTISFFQGREIIPEQVRGRPPAASKDVFGLPKMGPSSANRRPRRFGPRNRTLRLR